MTKMEKPTPKSEIIVTQYVPQRRDLWTLYSYSSDAANFINTECGTFGKLVYDSDNNFWLLMIGPGFDVNEVVKWIRAMGIETDTELDTPTPPEEDLKEVFLKKIQNAMLDFQKERDKKRPKPSTTLDSFDTLPLALVYSPDLGDDIWTNLIDFDESSPEEPPKKKRKPKKDNNDDDPKLPTS